MCGPKITMTEVDPDFAVEEAVLVAGGAALMRSIKLPTEFVFVFEFEL